MTLCYSNVQIIFGNGDGTFRTQSPMASPVEDATSIAVGDFNGDGVLDLAVAHEICCDPNVTIHLGKGNGTFTPPAGSFEVPVAYQGWGPGWTYVVYMGVGDFNGDDIPDLALGMEPDGGRVLNLLGEGDGTFALAESDTPPGLSRCCIAASDFNGDGLTDLLSNKVVLFTGASSSWTATATGVAPSSLGLHIVEANYSGDGHYESSSATTQLGRKAKISSPSPGIELDIPNVTFWWIQGTDVTEYEFTLGTTGPGSSNLYIGDFSVIWDGAEVNGIPLNGERVYARLSSLINGIWQYDDYTYVMVQSAVILNSPPPGTQLSGPTMDFSWTAGVGASPYRLIIGDNWIGSTDIYDSGVITTTSTHVTGLPVNGAPINVTLYYYALGAWRHTNYNYTEFGTPSQGVLTTPMPGTQLSGSTVDFSWTAGTGASSYRLIIGDICIGSTDLYDSGFITSTSAHVSLPPNGAPIYVTLYSKVNGIWLHTNYTYTEFGTPSQGVLTTPTLGTQLSGSTVDFSWTAGTGASSYRLIIGDICIGSTDLYDSGFITTTSAHVSLPPNGAPLFVTLYSKVNGIWRHTNYTYTEFGTPSQGVLTTPTPGTQLSGSTVDFSWTAGTGASSYRLIIGDICIGSTDLYDSGFITTTSAHVTGLPLNGALLFVTLYSKVNGVWLHTNYTYKAQ